MKGWLSPDSKIYNGLVTATDTIIVNVLLIIFSLPIITAGAAITGAHTALLQQAREEGSSPAKAFWKGFTTRFWRATIAWLIILAFSLVAAWEIWAIGRMELGLAGQAVTVIVITGIILLAGLAVWFFPLLSEGKRAAGESVKVPAVLALQYLPRTLACLALFLVQPLLLYINIDSLAPLVFANIFILPAAILYVHDLLLSEPLKHVGPARRP